MPLPFSNFLINILTSLSLSLPSFITLFKSLGRKRTYPLTGFLSVLILRKIFSIPTDFLLILLSLWRELRDFCGFNKVPDAPLFTCNTAKKGRTAYTYENMDFCTPDELSTIHTEPETLYRLKTYLIVILLYQAYQNTPKIWCSMSIQKQFWIMTVFLSLYNGKLSTTEEKII